jgi:hypothetical protein
MTADRTSWRRVALAVLASVLLLFTTAGSCGSGNDDAGTGQDTSGY